MSPASSDKLDREILLVCSVVVIGAIMSILDTTIVNVALATGLLLAPQGLGAALMMPISGRLTDRIGGGRVSLSGLIVMTAATVGLTGLTAHTPYTVTSAILFIRGIGLGFAMMPAMAAAYSTISRAAVPQVA